MPRLSLMRGSRNHGGKRRTLVMSVPNVTSPIRDITWGVTRKSGRVDLYFTGVKMVLLAIGCVVLRVFVRSCFSRYFRIGALHG